MSMDVFSRDQEKMRAHMRETFAGVPGYKMLEEPTRQNMALFGEAMKLFAPGMFQQPAAAAKTNGDGGEDIGAPDVLKRYQRWRRFDNLMLVGVTDVRP